MMEDAILREIVETVEFLLGEATEVSIYLQKIVEKDKSQPYWMKRESGVLATLSSGANLRAKLLKAKLGE